MARKTSRVNIFIPTISNFFSRWGRRRERSCPWQVIARLNGMKPIVCAPEGMVFAAQERRPTSG
jgi:hypothetical protein